MPRYSSRVTVSARGVIDLGEYIVGLNAVGDTARGQFAARGAAGELHENGGARGEAAQRDRAQAITRALADVRHERVEAARGVSDVLQAAVMMLASARSARSNAALMAESAPPALI